MDRKIFCSVCAKTQPEEERGEWWSEPLPNNRRWVWCKECKKQILMGQGTPTYML